MWPVGKQKVKTVCLVAITLVIVLTCYLYCQRHVITRVIRVDPRCTSVVHGIAELTKAVPIDNANTGKDDYRSQDLMPARRRILLGNVKILKRFESRAVFEDAS